MKLRDFTDISLLTGNTQISCLKPFFAEKNVDVTMLSKDYYLVTVERDGMFEVCFASDDGFYFSGNCVTLFKSNDPKDCEALIKFLQAKHFDPTSARSSGYDTIIKKSVNEFVRMSNPKLKVDNDKQPVK